VSPYGESKAGAEDLVLEAVQDGLGATALRLGQVYGEGGMSFVLEIVKALVGGGDLARYLPVFADHILHPIHIDDVVRGLLACAASPARGIYHLCGPEPATVGALFEVAALALGLPLSIGEPAEPDRETLRRHVETCRARGRADLLAYWMAGGPEAPHRAYATDRAARDFGCRPSVGVEEGIVRTLKWIKEQQDRQAA
jgi:nucleoside-diphosphate-sugar epimerase